MVLGDVVKRNSLYCSGLIKPEPIVCFRFLIGPNNIEFVCAKPMPVQEGIKPNALQSMVEV